MEGSTLNRPTNCIRDYLRTHLSFSLPFNPCNNGYFSEFHLEDEFNDGSMIDHTYSKPFVVLDMIWNLGFVFVSVFVLLCTLKEKPTSPLRVWICGYALQCVLHVGLVYYEYQRQINGFNGVLALEGHGHSRIVKRLESGNTIASSFWWVFGFYWILTGGQALLHDSPRLYWLAVVFLALDVFFMIFCIGLACIICLGLFCCIPIAAIAYAMTIREGASEEDIRLLPKYKFHQSYALRMSACMEFGSKKSTYENERALQVEDSECCICLSPYAEGAELCSLPCNHHFHNGCISRWLRINATCPLCKFNIKAKGDTLV